METTSNNEHFCLFCYRIFNREVYHQRENVDVTQVQIQFLQLLMIYLTNEIDTSNWINSLLASIKSSNESARNAISPCADCSGILKSFCDYYEEMKVLEMKLEWKLQTLMNIVKSSEKVKVRRSLFQEKLEESNEINGGQMDFNDLIRHLKNFRKELVEKCTGRFKESYPKVKLRRCDVSPIQKRHHQNNDRIQDDVNSKVPRLDQPVADLDDNNAALLAKIINEPGLKIEPSADPVPAILNECESEIDLIEEIQVSESDVMSIIRSPVRPIIIQDSDGDRGIETTGAMNVNASPKSPIPSIASGPSKLENSLAVIKAENSSITTVYCRTDSQPPIVNAVTLERNDESITLSDSIIVLGESDSFEAIKAENIISAVDFRIDRQPLEIKAVALENSESNLTYPIIAIADSNSKSSEPFNNESEASQDCGISLRRRYPCATCSQKFSSDEKLQEHMKNCVLPENNYSDEESEANHFSDNDNDFGCIESEEEEGHAFNAEEFRNDSGGEDSKAIRNDMKEEGKHRKNKHRLHKHEDYEFMKTPFKCEVEKCEFIFYNQADLDNHSKLHGNFKCSSCKTTSSYAPDLAKHELQHKLKLCKKLKSTNMTCLRENCTHAANTDYAFVKHFLTCYLKLPLNIHTCPICKFPVLADYYGKNPQGIGKMNLMNHLRTHHGPSHLEGREAGIRCDIPDCSAYFRKPSQLSYHRSIIHGNAEEMKNVCEECGAAFKFKKHLMLHEQTEHEDGFKIICDVSVCTRRFKSAINMKTHVALDHSHGNPENTCYFCDKAFKTRSILMLHQNRVHNKIELDLKSKRRQQRHEFVKDDVFQCPVTTCTEKFYKRESLQAHAKLHGNFKCFFCEERREYAPELAVHEASCKKLEPTKLKKSRKPLPTFSKTFSCPHCDFQATTYEMIYVQHHLLAHMNLELVVGNMCCICKWVHKSAECFRKYFSSHYANNHYNNDSLKTVFNCDKNECNAYFLSEDQLRAHKLNVHNEKSSYPCPDCGKVFLTKRKRLRHRKNKHKNKMDVSCTYQGCPLRFHDEESMQQHCYKHSRKVKSEICPTCGKICHGSSALATHTRSAHPLMPKEPKTKNFICPDCGKKFSTKDSLENHVLCVHVGPKGWQFTCDTCQKKCMTQQKLDEHQRTHTKEKPFSCEHCGLSYAHRHNFRLHLKSKHGIILETPKSGKNKE